MVGLRSQARNPYFGVSPIMASLFGVDVDGDRFLFAGATGFATVLRGDADCFNGHRRQTGLEAVLRSNANCFKGQSRHTPSSTNASVDGADVVASAAAARAGDVTMYATLPSLLC